MIYKDLGVGPKCDQVLVWLMVDKDPNVIKS